MNHNVLTVIVSVVSLSLIGALCGALLAYASEKFKVEVNPRVKAIFQLLPRANCGACGYASCIEFAQAIASGKADPMSCKVGGESTANRIAEIVRSGVAKPLGHG